MDSMRAVLMMLGVVIHSAQIFNPAQSWLIGSERTTFLAAYLVEFITTFRMPAFFVVSGFFCFLTLQKYAPRKFLTLRLKRILIPLLSTAIILNSIQTAVLIESEWLNTNWQSYLTKGGYISHLWFLTNLIIYFIAAFLISTLFPQQLAGLGRVITVLEEKLPLAAFLLLLPIASIAILATNKIGFPLYSNIAGVFSTYSIFIYTPYFIFGVALGFSKNLLSRFSTFNPLASLITIAGSLAILHLLQPSQGALLEISNVYFSSLICWASVSLCFYFFYNMLNSSSQAWLFLSDASYTVYLFHHLFVISLGLTLTKLNLPPIAVMTSIIAITIGSTLLLHNYFVLKVKPVRFLFNGK